MTISTLIRKTIAAGDGVTTAFNFAFQIRSAADLQVYYTDAAGVQTLLASNLYGVVLNPIPTGQLWSPGGTVTYPLAGTAIAVGTTLTIVRNVSLLQSSSLINQGGYFPDVVEAAIDVLTMEVQQINETIARSLVLQISSSASTALPNPIANASIGWDPTGTFITNILNMGVIAVPVSVAQGGTGAVTPALARLGLTIGIARRVLGLTAANNGGTPNTQFDINCDAVVLEDANGGTVTRAAPGLITNNFLTAGPAANGRDQVAAFGANSFVHLHYIWNPATLTLATLSSTSATAPTLPAGYTMWAYVGAVRFNGASAIITCRIKGAWTNYDNAQNVLSLTNAVTAVETAGAATSFVPTNALEWRLTQYGNITTAGAAATTQAYLRLIAGNDHMKPYVASPAGGMGSWGYETTLVNIAAGFFYFLLSVTNVTASQFNLDVLGFKNPNGGE